MAKPFKLEEEGTKKNPHQDDEASLQAKIINVIIKGNEDEFSFNDELPSSSKGCKTPASRDEKASDTASFKSSAKRRVQASAAKPKVGKIVKDKIQLHKESDSEPIITFRESGSNFSQRSNFSMMSQRASDIYSQISAASKRNPVGRRNYHRSGMNSFRNVKTFKSNATSLAGSRAGSVAGSLKTTPK